MQVVSFKSQVDPYFVTYANGLVLMWRWAVRSGQYLEGSLCDPASWIVTAGTTNRYTGYAINQNTSKSYKAKPVRHAQMLQEKSKHGQLFRTSLSWYVLTSRTDCFAPAVKIVPHGNTVVRRSGSMWFVNSAADTVPVTYETTREGVCISSVYDTYEIARFQRYPAPHHDVMNTDLALVHNGRLFFAHYLPEKWGNTSLLSVVENGNQEVDTLIRFDNPTYITDFDVSPDGRRLVVCLGGYHRLDHSTAREVRLYDLTRSGCNEVARFAIGGYRCCFASDGMTFAVVCVSDEYVTGVDKVRFLDVE